MSAVQHIERTFDEYADGHEETVYVATGTRGTRQAAPVVVQQRTTWQAERKKRGGIGYVVTPNGTVCHTNGVSVWPGINSDHLREHIREQVHADHHRLIRIQQNSEIVGNILVSYPGSHHGLFFLKQGMKKKPRIKNKSQPTIHLEVCPNPGATTYSSEPFCDGRRKCDHTDEFPSLPGHIVGEFHTHPRPGGQGDFRPHSNSDLYQLILAAYQQSHAYSVVVSEEGDYHAYASRRAVENLLTDLSVFYAQHGQTNEGMTRSLRTCRQPLLRLIQKDRTPYLWAVLVGSKDFYYDLMDDYRPAEKAHFIDQYIKWIQQRLFVDIEFVPAPDV